MHLGQPAIWILAGLYGVSAIVFGWISCSILIAASENEVKGLQAALQASASSAICLSSLFYARKLYRDIFLGLSQRDQTIAPPPQTATILYFAMRPLFALAISTVFVVLMFSAIREFSEGHAGTNSAFVFFSAISAAFIAIGTGTAVSKIEDIARSGHSFFRPPM
jgi:hypothetical protein